MKLVLDHRWEHALIAEIVAKASEKNEGYLGRTAMQKLLYFLQVLGVPMRYRFEIYHYGPFCSSIFQDIDWLVTDEVIVDSSPGGHYSDYKPSNSYEELHSQFASSLEEYDSQIAEVVDALSNLDPRTLELLATLHFCFRWMKAKGGEGPWREQTIERFKQVKKDKFQDEEIDRWYNTLIEADLIEG